MTLDSLPGDLHHMQELLDEGEKEIVGRVRGFLESKVAPIADDCWGRAEFPFESSPTQRRCTPTRAPARSTR